ncbi:hypothetical protein ACVIHI_003459 [Bradyrhizobium sp. USDA 4524]|uniref:hypothetical protein n=1 Tax=unclassified Bradyrhizobium TaxID=2631580 RepID=UPI00209CF24F|nr:MULTISPECIES: hypothetical protein [unclassified Bradyrhizobium]MCP1843623.1 hypothetical protein [Bradyrhizobium sp. USDA 4538]MCP1904189.1 hypothetical protein [Bradyrhizobium sp. USDA 4537]MCP1990155.1 hypothetical protein [Bradyrhizobium sp. USDA 4539]
MKLASIKKQIAALLAVVKPAHSLAARLDALSPDDRAHYERWKTRHDEWFERCKARRDDEIEVEARPYARMLEGYGPPTMRRDVETALFGEMPRILSTASDDDAAIIYRILLDEQR